MYSNFLCLFVLFFSARRRLSSFVQSQFFVDLSMHRLLHARTNTLAYRANRSPNEMLVRDICNVLFYTIQFLLALFVLESM